MAAVLRSGAPARRAPGTAIPAVPLLPLTILLLSFMAGCEFGTNPVIFDGSAATARFTVDSDIPFFLPPAFSVEDSVDLSGIYDGLEGVDSIRFYNLTLIAQGDSAALGVRVTGSIRVEDTPFLVFDDVPLSTFSPERSIFKPAAGFSYDSAGVAVIRGALAPGSATTMLRMAGDFQASSRSLHFSLQAKLYTQVFLRSPD